MTAQSDFGAGEALAWGQRGPQLGQSPINLARSRFSVNWQSVFIVHDGDSSSGELGLVSVQLFQACFRVAPQDHAERKHPPRPARTKARQKSYTPEPLLDRKSTRLN